MPRAAAQQPHHQLRFGGPGLRTLFITSACTGLSEAQRAAEPLAGGLFAVEIDSPGLPASLFAG